MPGPQLRSDAWLFLVFSRQTSRVKRSRMGSPRSVEPTIVDATLRVGNQSWCVMDFDLPALLQFAATYAYREGDLPIRFAAEPYTRIPIYRDDNIEIVVICFASGQTSSIHDHQGSNCVIRVVRGKVLECLFKTTGDTLELDRHHYLHAGEVSGLDGEQIHQLSNVDPGGTVLLNFYSPPFRMR